MSTETLDEQKRVITRSPKRSRPRGSAAGPTSRRSRRRPENGCCASFAPQEGDTVLELAAGVGETGFEAAALVGETGRLITSDFSPAMLEAARRRGTELGIANVDYRLIDADKGIAVMASRESRASPGSA